MSSRKTTGFTIVELLVVITIIGILIALLFPAINAVRHAARKANCINNEQQIATAILTRTARQNDFPKHLNDKADVKWPWAANVMRELGRGDLADMLQSGGPTSQPKRVELLICPADPPVQADGPSISYAGNAGKGDDANIAEGIFFRTKDVSLAYVANNDGVSTTLLISENVDATNWNANNVANMYESAIIWPAPAGFNQGIGSNHARPSSRHSGGFVAAFCDRHVQFLSDQIDTNVYNMIMTPNGGSAQGVLSEADLRE